MDVLACLARHQGRVVLKDELLAGNRPDRIITESGMVRALPNSANCSGTIPITPATLRPSPSEVTACWPRSSGSPAGDAGA